jgi:prepilin-type N-terminal cleavage/methylation domain-containing protein
MRRRGFTLIEILIAAAMGAVLLFLSAQVFRTALAGRERLRGASREQGALRRAYETISRDFHSAVVPPDDSGAQFGLIEAAGGGGGMAGLQFAAVVGEPLLAGRTANETVLVQYSIAPDPRDGRATLWRHEIPYPVPDTTDPNAASEGRAMPLLPGATGIAYVFYDPAQQTWIETWENRTDLPSAIRIDLAVGGDQGKGEPVQESWIFSLPAAKWAADEAAKAAESQGVTQ